MAQKIMLPFEDVKVAFAHKSKADLTRAYWLFKTMRLPSLMEMMSRLILFLLKIRCPIEGVIRVSIFRQFCGGENLEKCLPPMKKNKKYGVHTVLDYSVENNDEDEDFDKTVKTIILTMSLSRAVEGIAFSVFKPSAIGNISIYEKASQGKIHSDRDIKAWQKIQNRFDKLCAYALKIGIPILVDAEESWIQEAIDDLCEAMMAKYNKDKVFVYNTSQMYRKDRIEALKVWLDKAKKGKYKVGVKLVRGAYMIKENTRAEIKRYLSPIHSTKKHTDTDFNEALRFIINNLDVFHLFIGSHNEESNMLVMKILEEKNINNNTSKVWFGQLYGMSDHITFNLANLGYNTVKYMPFGPIKKVIPYLIRRIEENSSFNKHSIKECKRIKIELKRRRQEKRVYTT